MALFTTLLNGLTFGALLFLVSSGFTIAFGLMRVLNLAHGAFFMMGGLLGLAVIQQTGSFIAGLVAATVAIGILGFVTEVTLFRRVRLMPIREVLLTLGLSLIISDLAILMFGGNPQRLSPPPLLSGSVDVGTLIYPKYRLVLLVLAVILFVALRLLLVRTLIGAKVRAGVDNPEMLQAVGVNAQRLGTIVFTGASALVGITGLLGAGFIGVYPGVDVEILVYAVVVVVVGGLGSLEGAAIGSLAVGLLFSLGTAFAPALLYFIIFAPVILFLFFRPAGIRGVAQ